MCALRSVVHDLVLEWGARGPFITAYISICSATCKNPGRHSGKKYCMGVCISTSPHRGSNTTVSGSTSNGSSSTNVSSTSARRIYIIAAAAYPKILVKLQQIR